MMTAIAIGGFADLWLYSGREDRQILPGRDYRASVVASSECLTCGVSAGHPCLRPTVTGRSVPRRMPHFGRGGKPGRNAPRMPT
jgi:hypothetical protein